MRSFLYNKSDILIAVIIIAVAAVIIWSRVDAIMGSDAGTGNEENPSITGEELPPPDVENPDGDVEAPPVVEDGQPDGGETPPEGEAPPEGEGTTEGTEVPDTGGEPIEFTVEVGSAASVVAEDLASAGLVETSEAFLNELKAQNAETKLKAGTFEIVPGTAVSEIVKTLTN
jgi:hypothetical protein